MASIRYLVVSVVLGLCLSSAVSSQDPPTFTAYDLQTYNGVYEGDRVRFIGTVSVESARYGYSLTVGCDVPPVDPSGAYNGIAIYDRDQRLQAERGDTIDVVGILVEYYDKTEIDCSDETEFPPVVVGPGMPPSSFVLNCLLADSEPYENVFIKLRDVEVLGNPDEYGTIPVTDWTEHEYHLLLRSVIPPPPIGTIISLLFGDNDYHFGEFKMRPQDYPETWPTPRPTETPESTPSTPTPTATPTPDYPRVEIRMPADSFPPGSICSCFVTCVNPTTYDYPAAGLFVVLEVIGAYYFFPEFGTDVSCLEFDFMSGSEDAISVLSPFTVLPEWPLVEGLRWYAAVLSAEQELITPVDMREWSFGSGAM